jgi:regulator of replication initiation timing
MPRQTSITFEDFVAAATELESTGVKLTFASLRSRLGGVSYDVLRRYMDQHEAQGRQKAQAGGVPLSLTSGMHTLFEHARTEALASVRSELANEADKLVADRQLLATQQQDCLERTTRAETQAKMLAEQVSALLAKNKALAAGNEALQAEISALHTALASAQAVAQTNAEVRIQAELGFETERKKMAVGFENTALALGAALSRVQAQMQTQVEALYAAHLAKVEAVAIQTKDLVAHQGQNSEVEARKITGLVMGLEQATAALQVRCYAALDGLPKPKPKPKPKRSAATKPSRKRLKRP